MKILEIANRHGIPVVEDACPAVGAKINGRFAGTFGKVNAFSMHPLKNLNACGDGGFLVTDDDAIAQKIRVMRNHGLVDRNTVQRFGYVTRMDAVQAAIRTIVAGGVAKEYTIGNRSLKKYDMADLLQLESKLKAEVKREQMADLIANGLGNPHNLFVRF